jgi:hypothetical protein
MSMRVVETQCVLLKRVSLLPKKSDPKHLLWALYFLKVYPKQSLCCWAVGTSACAIDLKTHHKWVWAFIDAIANLVDITVSISYSHCEQGVDCVDCSEDTSTPFTFRTFNFPTLNMTLLHELPIFFPHPSSHPLPLLLLTTTD